MDLHGEIMNIHGEPLTGMDRQQRLLYKLGHRDARHAAAELAIAHDAKYAELMESHRELLAAVNHCREALRDNLSKYAYKNELIMLDALTVADNAIAKAEALGGEDGA